MVQGLVWQGSRQGGARHGWAWRGGARFKARLGEARRGMAWFVPARQGMVPGKARRGLARRG